MVPEAVTIEDARHMKQDAESRIASILLELEESTGMKISDLRFQNRIEKIGFFNKTERKGYDVRLTMEM